jgi:hypothetical protein
MSDKNTFACAFAVICLICMLSGQYGSAVLVALLWLFMGVAA